MEKEKNLKKIEQNSKLEVSKSHNGLPAIEVQNPPQELREIIKRAVHANQIGDPAYELRQKAGAFLQGDHEDWILVEFFQDDYQPFVDYLNSLINNKNKD